MTRHGIDVSSLQHPGGALIVWSQVRGYGIDWAAVKLTEGQTYKNPHAERDVHDATAAGLEVLGYHYARPSHNTPQAERSHLIATADNIGFAGPFVLDIEDGRQLGWGRLADWCESFLTPAIAAMVYWPRNYRDNLMRHWSGPVPNQWLAAPGGLHNGEVAAVEQYGQGLVPGIIGQVDLNYVHYDRLDRLPVHNPVDGSGRVADPATAPVLRYGSTGQAVAVLQSALGRAGTPVTVDCYFGDMTQRSVAKFQSARGLLSDGVVGPKTWAALNAAVGGF